MKILIVTPSAYTLSGLATWLDYLIPGLRKIGWRVCLGLVEGKKYHLPWKYLEHHPDLDWLSICSRTNTPQGRLEATVKAIKKTKPDIVVSVNIPDVFNAVHYLRSINFPSPKVVMTCHGIQYDLYQDMQKYTDTIDAIVCTNQLSCALAQNIGKISPDRIFYAQYGTTIPHKTTSSNKSGNRCFQLLYLGRIENQQKRTNDLIPLVKKLVAVHKSICLVVAGDGPDLSNLSEGFRNEQLLPNVKLLGKVSVDHILNELIPQSSALLMPSFWETGPIVIWEAMSRGLPVITSRYVGSGLEQSLIDGKNCLMHDIGDIQTMADSVMRLIDSTELSNYLAENALKMVQEKYSTPISIDIWDKVFHSILRLPNHKKTTSHFSPKSSGRLDRLIGPSRAEFVRKFLPSKAMANDPGDEWPHTHSECNNNDAAFWDLAIKLDRQEVTNA